MEIKGIQAIHTFDKRLCELQFFIPVYQARNPTCDNALAKQIINFDIERFAAKSKQFPTHLPAPHSFAPQWFLAHQPAAHILSPQQIVLHDITEFLTEHIRQIPNLYWQPGKPINTPVRNFWQIKYIPLLNAVSDNDQALFDARLDCARDSHKQLIDFGPAAKVWMMVQVEYEPVNSLRISSQLNNI